MQVIVNAGNYSAGLTVGKLVETLNATLAAMPPEDQATLRVAAANSISSGGSLEVRHGRKETRLEQQRRANAAAAETEAAETEAAETELEPVA